MSVNLAEPLLAQAEQRVALKGVSWQQYEILLATLGDTFPNLRLSYLEGMLEIMTTAPEHEELKTIIAIGILEKRSSTHTSIGVRPLT